MTMSHSQGTFRRVVVTGLGLVTPLGTGVPIVWKRILNKASGIRSLGPKYEKLPCRVAGDVPTTQMDPEGGLDLEKRFSDSERRSGSRATLFSLVAADEAILNSKLNPDKLTEEEKERIGVAIGMGLVDLEDVIETGQILNTKGYSRVTPFFIPRILLNLAAGQVSMKYGFQGPNHCASTACATGAHSIGDAFNFIRNSVADVMICGGTESSINTLSIATFSRLRALSTKFNDVPEKSSRPFDELRDGFVMGEGAGILVIEELQHALKRGANIYGEILGYGLSGDAYHLTAAREDGHGAYRAMKQALDMAKIIPDSLSYINCHATSTPIGDKAEIKGLRKLFNSENVGKVAISSTKGSHGHLLGAAGAVESILTILACHNRIAIPSINIENLDNDFKSLNIVQSSNNELRSNSSNQIVALKNSFGFGGTNASLCFSSFVP